MGQKGSRTDAGREEIEAWVQERALKNAVPAAIASCNWIGMKYSRHRCARRNRLVMELLSPPGLSSTKANIVNVHGLADHQVDMVVASELAPADTEKIAWAWFDSTTTIRYVGQTFMEKLTVGRGVFRNMLDILADRDSLATTVVNNLAGRSFHFKRAGGSRNVGPACSEFWNEANLYVVCAFDGEFPKMLFGGIDIGVDSLTDPSVPVAAGKLSEGSFLVLRTLGDDVRLVVVWEHGRVCSLSGDYSEPYSIPVEEANFFRSMFEYHQEMGFNCYESAVRAGVLLGSVGPSLIDEPFRPERAKVVRDLLHKAGELHFGFCQTLKSTSSGEWSPVYSVEELRAITGLNSSGATRRLHLSRAKAVAARSVTATEPRRWDPPPGSSLEGIELLSELHSKRANAPGVRKAKDLILKRKVNLAVQVLRSEVLGDSENCWKDFDDKLGVGIAVTTVEGLTSIKAAQTGHTDVYNFDTRKQRDVDEVKAQPFASSQVSFLEAYSVILKTCGAGEGLDNFCSELENHLAEDYMNIFSMRSMITNFCGEHFRTPFRKVKSHINARFPDFSEAAHITREVATIIVRSGGRSQTLNCAFCLLKHFAPETNEYQIDLDERLPLAGVEYVTLLRQPNEGYLLLEGGWRSKYKLEKTVPLLYHLDTPEKDEPRLEGLRGRWNIVCSAG